MRLTLRTLLAYLDDILEPEDHKDIGAKVSDSEVATTLVHRTRDVMRRLRLGAPQMIGTGMGRDPNSVAEYLDNTLAAEQVQLFERVCLESDVHLAEVGSCHHILAMILGEPAQVDPASRERMYRLIDVAAERAAAESAAAATVVAAAATPAAKMAPAAAVPAQAEPSTSARRKLEVPEYLRTSSGGRLRPAVLTLVAAALATAVILLIVDHSLLNRLLGRKEIPSVVKSTTPPDSPPPAPGQSQSNVGDNKSGLKGAGAGTSPAKLAVQDSHEKSDGGKPGKTAATVTAPGVTAPVRHADTSPADAGGKTTPPVAIVPPAPKTPDVTFRPASAAGAGKVPADRIASNDLKTAGRPPGGDAGTLPLAPKPADAPPVRLAVGRLLSSEQVLLRADSKSEQWERVPKGAPLYAGERLLVLPAFRPMISVLGVSMELDGASELELGRPDAAGNPQISVAFGRLIVRPLGQPNARLHARLDVNLDGLLSFGDADSTLALEVRPYRDPAGTDPEKVASRRRVTLYAASGRINWTDTAADNRMDKLPAPRRLMLSGGSGGAAEPKTVQLPGWIAAAELNSLEQRGARAIEQALSADRSIKLTLDEQTAPQQRRVEVRSLATRCCAYIGYFDPLVKGLSDDEQHAGWPTYVADLRDAVARDAPTAAKVRETFEKLRRERAADLYRLLWGYTPKGLADGDAGKLVEYLDDNDLDVRVLSFWNLQDITGGLGLNYRPESAEAKRSQSILRWKKRLEERKIAPATPPAPPMTPAKGT